LCARRGERLAGAVPVTLTRRFGLSWARSLPFGTFGGPLVAAGEPDPATVRSTLADAFGAWLAAERVAGGEVTHAPLTEGARPDPAWAALAAEVREGVAHVVDLAPGPEALRAALRKRSRQALTHALRFGAEVSERPEALPEIYSFYRKQGRGWAGHRPYSLPFLRALLDHPSGFARLLVTACHGQLEAGVMVLTGGDEAFIWWTGAGSASRRSLSFTHLLFSVFEHAWAAGARRVNIGGSGGQERLHRFKESLGAVPRPVFVYRLGPRRDDWLARAYRALRG
jgi:hypothetical protein